MAEQYQPINVNTGSAQQAIQATPNVTPNLEGLMQGIQSGFISADDIRKRVANGPLEAATRAQDMADTTQIRPLQREAVAAQLPNVVAKEKFVAESLPILQAQGRITLAQDFENAKQNGAPDAILKSFYASVPGIIPWDPDKLTDKKTGQLNLAYAIETTQKAHEKAAQIAGQKSVLVKSTNVDATGRETSAEQYMNPVTGVATGVSIPTGVKEVNVNDAAKVKNQSAEGFRKEFYQADTVQALNKVDAAVNKIRLSAVTDSTPFQDMSAIFGFMKVLDPGSTVREGEYATVQKSTGVPDRIRNLYNAVINGAKLTSDQKTELLASAEQNYQGQLQNAAPSIRQFLDLESKNGFAPGTIVPVEFATKLATPASGGSLADMSIEQLKEVSIGGGSTGASAGAGTIPTVQTPAEAAALPPTVQYFKTPTGTVKINPNFRP